MKDNRSAIHQPLQQGTVGQGKGETVLAGEVDLLQGVQRILQVDLIGSRRAGIGTVSAVGLRGVAVVISRGEQQDGWQISK